MEKGARSQLASDYLINGAHTTGCMPARAHFTQIAISGREVVDLP
jgi:hypothetical protein